MNILFFVRILYLNDKNIIDVNQSTGICLDHHYVGFDIVGGKLTPKVIIILLG